MPLAGGYPGDFHQPACKRKDRQGRFSHASWGVSVPWRTERATGSRSTPRVDAASEPPFPAGSSRRPALPRWAERGGQAVPAAAKLARLTDFCPVAKLIRLCFRLAELLISNWFESTHTTADCEDVRAKTRRDPLVALACFVLPVAR